MNPELAHLAAPQYGTFTAGQADDCRLARSTLHDQVKAGLISILHPGVYAVAGSPAIWGLWEIADPKDDIVEITVPRARYPRLEGVTIRRSGDLHLDHVSRWKRFPVTKPARMIIDLGAVLSPEQVEDVLDRALTRKLITIPGVEWMLNELSRPGRTGVGVAGRILDERALGKERAHGQLEPRMARLLRKAGHRPARFQYRIHAPDGHFLAQVDFAYPELLLAIEVDGWETHGTPRAMGKDFVRQNGLVPFGWRVLRFTWTQVVRQPDYVAATIAQTLTSLAA